MEIMAAMAASRGIPVIVNIHNVALAKRFCQRMIGMNNGQVVFNGTPAELTDENLKTIYGGEDWLE
jgi:phosphonate transport system ATP-binding protein